MLDDATKKTLLPRIKRITGQLEGVGRMVEEERYCIDIVDQVNAIRRALEQVALIIMKRHVESCVAESIRTRKGNDKIGELISAIDRFIR